MPLSVILSEVSDANEAEGSRTGSRKRTRYRFLVREALTSCAKVSQGREGEQKARFFLFDTNRNMTQEECTVPFSARIGARSGRLPLLAKRKVGALSAGGRIEGPNRISSHQN